MSKPASPLPGTYSLICPETGAGIRFAPAPWPGLPEEVEVFTRDFMGVAPEELHLPNLFLAWKPHGSTLHWERWEAPGPCERAT